MNTRCMTTTGAETPKLTSAQLEDPAIKSAVNGSALGGLLVGFGLPVLGMALTNREPTMKWVGGASLLVGAVILFGSRATSDGTKV